VAYIPVEIDELLAYIEAWLIWAIESIHNWIINLSAQISQWFAGMIDTVSAWLAQVYTVFLDAFYQLAAQITEMFDNLLGQVSGFFETVLQKILDATSVAVDRIRHYVGQILNKIEGMVAWLIAEVQGWLQFAIAAVVNLAEAGIDAVRVFVDAVIERVNQSVSSQLGLAEAMFTQVSSRIREALDDMLIGPEAILDAVAEKMVNLKDAFASAATELVEGLGVATGDLSEKLRTMVDDAVEKLLVFATPDQIKDELASIHEMTHSPTTVQADRGAIMEFWRKLTPSTMLGRSVFLSLFGMAWGLQLYAAIGGDMSQIMAQEWRAQYHPTMLSASELVSGWRAGDLDQDTALTGLERWGFTRENGQRLLNISGNAPAPVELMSMWRREIIPKQQRDAGMLRAGLAPEWFEAYEQASYPLPPIQDLITMAVREVFTPATVERFGQMEDFPEAFGEWAQKQGLTLDWAQKYWAAHWALPSPRQGFEMLHRGIIEKPDLELLLRSLDVMPFWRDRLIQVAYSPYTRVDVRRMHKLGILTEGQVTEAYRDLGYDLERADNLTAFTVALNTPANLDDDLELGALSRTSILGFYEDGLLNMDRAAKLLTDLGYTPEAAALYLQAVDSDEERATRKAETDQILEQAESGVLTFNEAQDQLRALGLETAEVDKAVTRLLRIQQKRTKIPSRAEGEAMMKAGVLSVGDYRELLARLGYSTRWSDAYIELAKRKSRGSTFPS